MVIITTLKNVLASHSTNQRCALWCFNFVMFNLHTVSQLQHGFKLSLWKASCQKQT